MPWEVGGVRPVLEVGRGVDADDEFLGVGNYHDPALGGGVPDYLRVTDLRAVDRDDGVRGVICEGVAVVEGVGDFLRFFC